MLRKTSAQGLVLLVSALLCVACAKSNDSKPTDQAQGSSGSINVVNADDLRAAQSAAAASSVNCADTKCNPAVGMISMAWAEGDQAMYGSCTGSLIGSDVVLTNSHCIPPDLQSAGASCKGRVWMNFPENRQYETQISCKEIIFVSDKGTTAHPKRDYALFRLSRSSRRPPLKLSSQGFRDEQSYQLLKVNPLNYRDRIEGNLGHTNCTAIFNSKISQELLGGTGSQFADLMSFGDCYVVHGNSGSPILSEEGTVLGLIQITIDTNSLLELFKDENLLDGAFTPMGVGTNLACVDLLGNGIRNSACDRSQPPPLIDEQLRKLAIERGVQKKLAEEQAYLNEQGLGFVRWQSTLSEAADNAGRILTIAPFCIDARQAGRQLPVRRTNIALLSASLELGYDRYARLAAHFTDSSSEDVRRDIYVTSTPGASAAYMLTESTPMAQLQSFALPSCH